MAYTPKLSACAVRLATGAAWPAAISAQTTATIEPMVTGLETPWAVAPMADGGILITQLAGELMYVRGDTRTSVTGVPEVADGGQGGLLDITLARD